MKVIKVLILGAQSVGKTSILHQLLFGPVFNYDASNMPQLLPTIEDVYFASVEQFDYNMIQHNHHPHHQPLARVNQQNREADKLLFFDVAGIKQNIDIESLRNYVALAEEFVLVYSINDYASFNIVDKIKKLIDQCKDRRDPPTIVLANKADLNLERQVDFEEESAWASRENIKLFEVTATERTTLNEFIYYLANRVSPSQQPSSLAFKLRRSKTTQSSAAS